MPNPLLEKEVEAFEDRFIASYFMSEGAKKTVVEHLTQALERVYELARLEKAEMLERVQAPLTAYQFSGEKEAVYVLTQINQAITQEAKQLISNQTQP